MAKSANRSTEVGQFIRKQVIPQGMSVTEAAKRLRVGRPALSNLLNGRAALSDRMAVRLEQTFGADRKRLFDLKTASERDRQRDKERTVPVSSYVPDFLTIKAREIADWASTNIDARQELPVLLRRLIHSTARELRRVDFPGFDNAQRQGWDGWVEADAATPWVPAGASGWEFGVGQRVRTKAEHDYHTRLNMLTAAERADCTFVFVTPNNWPDKNKWARSKDASGDWKAVRAFDASDMEQWLETVIAPRIWLAGKLGTAKTGFQTIEEYWDQWAAASEPPMSTAIFAPSVEAHWKVFKAWLDAQSHRPLTVAADSREEAVAFLACLLRHPELPAHASDQAVYFESADTLKTLSQSSSPFIPIVCGDASERELVTQYRQRNCIVVRPRNAVDRKPDITIDPLGHTDFEAALVDMQIDRARVDRLARESGRSPTVLRRRLSHIDAIRTPLWAGDPMIARRLVPVTLVGQWHNGSKADRDILAVLAGHPYQEVEAGIADLIQHDDCPVWSVDEYRGIVSKIDALFAIRSSITATDITNFVDFAEYALSESDPALELPEDKRWMAELYGKVREHSAALRSGVCETLVLLAVHGNALFRDPLGIDVKAQVSSLIRRLLTPFTSATLLTHDDDLPGYAEAAPDAFLTLLEEDLTRPEPALRTLLKPADSGVFDGPSRTGILWALERLAWNPQTLMRVVVILAELTKTEINDNWANTPINSLSGIFRSWVPQTAATLHERIRALETLCRRFPEIGWQICIQQFEVGPQIGDFNEKPRWRNDAAGSGDGVTITERREFSRKALDLAISWTTHDAAKFADLVERLDGMPAPDRLLVWNLIDTWSQTATDEKAKTALRERIRRTVLTWRALQRGSIVDQRNRAWKVYRRLAPSDPITRHAWLFANAWVEESADEPDDDIPDFEKQRQRIHELRTEAIDEIHTVHGLDGVFALLANGDGWTIGRYAVSLGADQPWTTDVLCNCLSRKSHEKVDNFMRGFLESVDERVRPTLISTVSEIATFDENVRLFRCAPFCKQTWDILNRKAKTVRDEYWRTVFPITPGSQFTESETNEFIDRLLDAKRPRAAFFAVRFDWKRVETSRLKRLLWKIGHVNAEPVGEFRIESHSLSEALDSLAGRPGVTVSEMARLELAYVEALDRTEHGIPNVERELADSPGLFVQALALLCKRGDDGQDPPELQVDDDAGRRSAAKAAYQLLQQIERIPGTDDDGKVQEHALRQWVADARRLCREYGRADIGDEQIGQLLSNAPQEEDGSWPCRPVCEVMETIASPDIATGLAIGVYNGRGAHWSDPDEGGRQERELATKYRTAAQGLVFDYPYVASVLERIAETYERDAAREDSDVRVRRRLER